MKITYEEQLKRWVAGESVHRDDDDEIPFLCTPDFSCCKPELAADLETRKAFVAGGDEERARLCGSFLHAAMGLMAKEKDVRAPPRAEAPIQVRCERCGSGPGEPCSPQINECCPGSLSYDQELAWSGYHAAREWRARGQCWLCKSALVGDGSLAACPRSCPPCTQFDEAK